MPRNKYPILYVQNVTPNGGLHLDAWELEHHEVFVGTHKLMDLLDELYKLRKDIKKYER